MGAKADLAFGLVVIWSQADSNELFNPGSVRIQFQ
jgi:hypothetical protein